MVRNGKATASVRPEQAPGRATSIRMLLPLLGLALLAVVSTACSSNSGPPTSDVAGAIPWPSSESVNYTVKNRKGDELGKIVLAVDASGGSTKLSQLFDGSNTTDNSSVMVDSRTLKPMSSEREIKTPKDDTRIVATYTEQGVLIKQGDDKESGLSVPEHSYDNDSSLFLWRTLPFANEYQGSYITIVTNRRTRQTVHLRVLGKETVNVAGGSFEAWKLQVKAAGVTQLAWYADSGSHQLVRYDNDNGLIYELAK